MSSLQSVASKFEARGVRLVGISIDDVATMKTFAEAKSLTFDLLADPSGTVVRDYGVWRRGFARRVSFVLDPQGIVRHVDESVRISRHGADLLARLRDLGT